MFGTGHARGRREVAANWTSVAASGSASIPTHTGMALRTLHSLRMLHTLHRPVRLPNGVTRVYGVQAAGAHDAAPRGSCAGPAAAPACAPCPPRAPPPACRAAARPPLRGVRVACRAPPRGQLPPCALTAPPCTLTCEHSAQNTSASSAATIKCKAGATINGEKRCGDSLDRVAKRIAAAKRSRRQEYEQEAAQWAQRGVCTTSTTGTTNTTLPPPAAYRLGEDREVVRATDGRDYIVLPPPPASRNNSHSKDAPDAPPRTVHLDSADGCAINHSSSIDPCAHEPRIILEIDRSEILKCSKSNTTQGHKSESKVTVPKKLCKRNDSGTLTGWCSSPPAVEPQSTPCRQQTILEKIKLRSKSSCDGVRKLHTATARCQCQVQSGAESDIQAIAARVNADTEKFNKMLSEKNGLKEAGRGRVTVLENAPESATGGHLEMAVPAGTRAVRVQMSLLGDPAPRGPAGPQHDHSHRCDSWLSIKNIQKKLSGCRKDTSPTENSETKKCPYHERPAAGDKLNAGSSPCKPKQPPHPPPRGHTQPNQKCTPRPCNMNSPVKPPQCSSTMKFLPNNIILL